MKIQLFEINFVVVVDVYIDVDIEVDVDVVLVLVVVAAAEDIYFWRLLLCQISSCLYSPS